MHLSAKPTQRLGLPGLRPPQGRRKTTASIGRRRKRGDALTRPVLIVREACAFSFPPSLRSHVPGSVVPAQMCAGTERTAIRSIVRAVSRRKRAPERNGLHSIDRSFRAVAYLPQASRLPFLFPWWPWRGGNTRSHSEHGSEGPQWRGYCGNRPWESSAPPRFFFQAARIGDDPDGLFFSLGPGGPGGTGRTGGPGGPGGSGGRGRDELDARGGVFVGDGQ